MSRYTKQRRADREKVRGLQRQINELAIENINLANRLREIPEAVERKMAAQLIPQLDQLLETDRRFFYGAAEFEKRTSQAVLEFGERLVRVEWWIDIGLPLVMLAVMVMVLIVNVLFN